MRLKHPSLLVNFDNPEHRGPSRDRHGPRSRGRKDHGPKYPGAGYPAPTMSPDFDDGPENRTQAHMEGEDFFQQDCIASLQ